MAADREIIKSGELSSEFNWNLDLYRAETYHARLIAWADRNKQLQDLWVDEYRAGAKEFRRFNMGIAQEGMKYILAIHGATAITCLTALVNTRTDAQYRPALQFAIFAAAIGIMMLAVGQIILLLSSQHVIGKVSSHILFKRGWRSIRAADRYHNRYTKAPFWWAEFLIFGSIAWFAIYGVISFLLIVQYA